MELEKAILDQFDYLMINLKEDYDKLFSHPLYGAIDTLESLQVFMESHAFAVWDFMSLLKALQQRLTCVKTPWIPPRNILAARLINEIVLGEESDEVAPGHYRGHFDLYIEAMGEVEANGCLILNFIDLISEDMELEKAFEHIPLPDETKKFVLTTMDIVKNGNTHEIASAFLFGREDIIPQMFERILHGLVENYGGDYKAFALYLKRHIEVDGGDHSVKGKRLLQDLCGQDETKWNEALLSAKRAIHARINLWDGILGELKSLGFVSDIGVA